MSTRLLCLNARSALPVLKPFMWIKNVEFVTSVFSIGDLPGGGFPEIAFAGRSNVGKSSLLNRLFGTRKLVKVSSTPGHTQSLNFFLVNRSAYLIDLPGYGYARAPRRVQAQWQKLVEGYLQQSSNLKGVVCILDIRRDPDQLDLDLFHYIHFLGKEAWLVLNKADKLKQSGIQKRIRSIGRVIPDFVHGPWTVSARTGLGMNTLSEHLASVFNVKT